MRMQGTVQLGQEHLKMEPELARQLGISGIRIRSLLVRRLYDMAAAGSLTQNQEIVEIVERIRAVKDCGDRTIVEIILVALTHYLRSREK